MGRNLRKLELRFCLNRSPFMPFFQLIIIFNPRKNLWGRRRDWKKSEKRKSFKIISPWCLKEKPMMAIAFLGRGNVIPTLLKRKNFDVEMVEKSFLLFLRVEIYFSLLHFSLFRKKNRLKNETVLKFMERRKCQQFHLASHSFPSHTLNIHASTLVLCSPVIC